MAIHVIYDRLKRGTDDSSTTCKNLLLYKIQKYRNRYKTVNQSEFLQYEYDILFFNADKKVTRIYLANIFYVVLFAWRKYINKLTGYKETDLMPLC